MSWVFDTLIWTGQNGYVPALAESWSYDPDRMAFTSHERLHTCHEFVTIHITNVILRKIHSHDFHNHSLLVLVIKLNHEKQLFVMRKRISKWGGMSIETCPNVDLLKDQHQKIYANCHF
jgi:hypothetical protein